jgi:D-alanyl-D-alanine dipeptidase
MPGFQPLGRPRPALGCEARVSDEADNGGSVDVDVVIVAVAFTVDAGIDDGIDGLFCCLGRGTGVDFGTGFDDVSATANAEENGLVGSLLR